MKYILPLALLGSLAACVPAQPVVTSFNGDSVTVVTAAFADVDEAKAKAQAEADVICRRGHRKKAEYVSVKTNPNTYENSHLFLCLN